MEERIVVTGGSGLLGRELQKIVNNKDIYYFLSSKDYELTKELDVIKLFVELKPTKVIHLAARVGGILDNMNNQTTYFNDNILMNTLLVKYAHLHDVKYFLGIASTCAYPDKNDKYPMVESDLFNGTPTQTNFAYSYAKRCQAIQIEAYRQQFGLNYGYIIPTNLYGFGDKNDVNKSHFVTALIKKIIDAKKNGDKYITLFGDGTPLRQFLYAEDLAKIIKYYIDNNITETINICNDETYTIDEIARIALKATNSEHLEIKYDNTKPNGQYRKDVSNQKLKNLYSDFKFTSLYDGIKTSFEKEWKLNQ
jgi:GDP-L-fucose synthase